MHYLTLTTFTVPASIYRKTPKNLDIQKIAVIIQKFEQYCFTTE